MQPAAIFICSNRVGQAIRFGALYKALGVITFLRITCPVHSVLGFDNPTDALPEKRFRPQALVS